MADWAATFWLMSEPRMAQVARKSVAEKNARRVRGAIGLGYLRNVVKAAHTCGARTDVLLIGRSIAFGGELGLDAKRGFACSGRGQLELGTDTVQCHG